MVINALIIYLKVLCLSQYAAIPASYPKLKGAYVIGCFSSDRLYVQPQLGANSILRFFPSSPNSPEKIITEGDESLIGSIDGSEIWLASFRPATGEKTAQIPSHVLYLGRYTVAGETITYRPPMFGTEDSYSETRLVGQIDGLAFDSQNRLLFVLEMERNHRYRVLKFIGGKQRVIAQISTPNSLSGLAVNFRAGCMYYLEDTDKKRWLVRRNFTNGQQRVVYELERIGLGDEENFDYRLQLALINRGKHLAVSGPRALLMFNVSD